MGILKSTLPLKTHVKKKLGTSFIILKGSLDIFRKIHKVTALNFDSFGVKLRVESDLGGHSQAAVSLEERRQGRHGQR